MRIVLDTNILISALVFGGKPWKLFERFLSGKHQLILSEFILEELRRVLEGKKFKYPREVSKRILLELRNLAEVVHPTKKVKFIQKDPSDNRILECALASKTELIISGDQHLLELKECGNISILPPDEFLKLK